jgi:hypothetical protein
MDIGETQKCIIENHYEPYPGYKGEENIQDDRLKINLGYNYLFFEFLC